MKLLIITPRFPYPLDKGDRLTVYNLLKFFSKRHDIYFLSFLEPAQKGIDISVIKGFCKKYDIVKLKPICSYLNCLQSAFKVKPLQVSYYSTHSMQRKVNEYLEKFRPDLLYAHSIRMGSYIEDSTQPKILAMQVSMSLQYKRQMNNERNPLKKVVYAYEYFVLRRFESEISRKFDYCLLVSKKDKDELESSGLSGRVFLNPHGVDFEYFRPHDLPKEKNSLVFTGNMGFNANIDAALYFYNDILPMIKKEIPGVKLYIVGANPSKNLNKIAKDKSVVVTGRVPDLRPYIEKSQVAIDPLRIGAGLQNKILEGMSMELPMVVTEIANEGIGAVDGEHIFVASNSSDFASKVCMLLKNPSLRRRIGENARQFIEVNWSWKKHFSDLEHLMIEVTNKQKKENTL